MKRALPTWLLAVVAFVLTLAVHAAHVRTQGLTDDDDFYAPAGIRYFTWITDVVGDPAKALTRASMDKAFELNREHPPGAKLVIGAAHALFHDATGLLPSLDAARMGTALFASLLAALLVALLRRPLGTPTAIAAPFLLFSLPRFFFHSEVATLDVPVACAVFAVTAAFFAADRARAAVVDGESGARARRREIACGVVFGLALLVKLNAPFALVPCVVWALLARWRGFSVDAARSALVIPPVPPAIVWMIVLGPLVFVALWPWLWHDTFPRLGAYFAFHMSHYPILHFFEGEIWERPFAPSRTVLVLAFGAMPLSVVVLGLLGAARALRACVRLARHADAAGDARDVSDGDRLRALLVLQAGFSLLITMSPSVPRYGGEKLFMPFFPLWCALAADGAALVVDAMRTLAPRLVAPVASAPPARDVRRGALAGVVVALACAPGIAGTNEHRGGYALSYFGETVGGLRGAVARGYERTYYDIADKPLARFLDENAAGARVAFAPNHKEYARTYRWLKRDGYVSQRLTLEPDWRKAGIVVLTHERRWSTYPSILATLEGPAYERIHEKRVDDVPLWTVYRRR